MMNATNPLVPFIGHRVRIVRTVFGQPCTYEGLVRKAWNAGDGPDVTRHGAILEEAETSGGFDCSAILSVEAVS